MHSKINHRFVNWQDGMLLSKEHLTLQDLAIQAAIYDTAAFSINSHNYGVLPASDGHSSSLDIQLQADTIEVVSVRGITPNGIRIEWNVSSELQPLKISVNSLKSYSDNSGFLYLVLRVKPFQYVEIGEISESDSTNRRPFLMIKPEMELVSYSDILSDSFSFPIFRVHNHNGSLQADNTYIPPSVSVHGKQLTNHYQALGKMFESIIQSSKHIVRHVNGKTNRHQIAIDMYLITDKILNYGAGFLDAYKLISPQEPPIYFINILIGLVRSIQIGIDSLPEKNLQLLQGYITQLEGQGETNTYRNSYNLNKTNLQSYFNAVLGMPYDHNNVFRLIDGLNSCLDFWETILMKLKQRDLTGPDSKGSWTIY